MIGMLHARGCSMVDCQLFLCCRCNRRIGRCQHMGVIVEGIEGEWCIGCWFGEKPFGCRDCSERFANWIESYQHYLRVHTTYFEAG